MLLLVVVFVLLCVVGFQLIRGLFFRGGRGMGGWGRPWFGGWFGGWDRGAGWGDLGTRGGWGPEGGPRGPHRGGPDRRGPGGPDGRGGGPGGPGMRA